LPVWGQSLFYMKKTCLLLLSICLICINSCKDSTSGTIITLNLKVGPNEKVYVEQVAFNDEKNYIVDSATVTDNHHSIIFHIKSAEERLLRVRFTNSNMRISFINDMPQIKITANWFKNSYTVTGSPATVQLQRFQADQLTLSNKLKQIWEQEKNSLGKSGMHQSSKFNTALTALTQMPVNYSDTVKDPALFMFVYNGIDFGKNYGKQRDVIQHAASRFAKYQPVQKLKDRVLNYIAIFEHPLKVNDQLPAITLPDTNGNEISTASLTGKYYLINIWSTYCTECLLYNNEANILREKLPASRFEIAGIAIDDQKSTWKNIIKTYHYKGIQLIDEAMWNGTTVSTLKIDSLPYNYLVSPTGKILQKNIPRKDLQKVTFSYLKRN
jgi:hypothetical protein